MTGSLQIKNGKYYAVINLYEKGKRKQKWICTDLETRGNKKKAEKILREKISEWETKQGLSTCETTFSDYVEYWLEISKMRVDEVTLQGYEVVARTHIIPYFKEGNIKLDEINRNHIQEYINIKYERGKKNGKGGLSPTSLKRHKVIIQQVLKEAQKNNIILNNPCEFVTLPKIQHYEYHFYTAEQLNELFHCIKDEPLFPLIKTAVVYGLRRSELLGLQWDSINFENSTLTIKHTVSKVTKAVAKDKTKNSSSHRGFPLLPEMEQLFLNLKEQETKNRSLFGNEYQESPYIFKWDNGNTFNPDYITHKFSKLLKKNMLPHIRFHDLRHSCASLLIAKGFNLKDIQEWLGHADIKLTANIYSHIDMERKRDIAQTLGKTFKEIE